MPTKRKAKPRKPAKDYAAQPAVAGILKMLCSKRGATIKGDGPGLRAPHREGDALPAPLSGRRIPE